MSLTKSSCLADGFTTKEKIFAQTTFFGILIVGTIGILRVDMRFVIPYVFIAWYGIPGIIQRHIVCPRCPHLIEHEDCLQLHPAITKWLIKKPKGPRFSLKEKAGFIFIMGMIPIYPLYWLSYNLPLLVLFISFAGLWYCGQILYFCNKCRVKHCPFNRIVIKNKNIEHRAGRGNPLKNSHGQN